MSLYEEVDPESYAQGWRKSLQEALDAAMADEEREVDVIYVRKRNPIHEYRITLK
jgi:hypothetical protein